MKSTRNGFTLVEMLVSMAVGSVVLLLAVASLGRTGEEYGRSTDGVAAEREARAILTQVAEDLSKVSGGILDIESSSESWRKDSIAFTCLQPPDAQSRDEAIGDLCLTSYYVKDLMMGRETVRCLMRGFRGSDEVFAAIRNGQVETLYGERPADEPVAFGVVAFEVDPLTRQASGQWEDWQAPAEGEPAVVDPGAVRLRLVVARRELEAKLRTSEDWDSSRLLGDPAEARRSKLLEVYEIIHPFGHAR